MDKTNRPQRRLNRRVWLAENHDESDGRVVKRLFTPEIKRMLKDWLIRRRENPYPSRDEKKRLAIETGLTYTQICNWFANWRRKLKNSERERSKKSWGHLIKNYNSNAKGNVEQFSISSEDSIWEEDEQRIDNCDRLQNSDDEDVNVGDEYDDQHHHRSNIIQNNTYANIHSNNNKNSSYINNNNNNNYCYYNNNGDKKQGCYDNCFWEKNNEMNLKKTDARSEVAAQSNFHFYTAKNHTNRNENEAEKNCDKKAFSNTITESCLQLQNNTKYKQKIMEKYLRDTCEEQQNALETLNASYDQSGGNELSKWLESAANFTPNKNNYFLEWNPKKSKSEKLQFASGRSKPLNNLHSHNCINSHETQPQEDDQQTLILNSIHHKDELDAAEALANLAFNCRQRVFDNSKIPSTMSAAQYNTISS